MKQNIGIVVILFHLMVGFMACKNNKNEVETPSNLISEKEMVQLLVEMQTADAASARTGINAETRKIQRTVYNEAIFEKYKTSGKDFYESYDYYARNVATLDTIYAQVMTELEGQLKVETERMKKNPPKTPLPPPVNIPKNLNAPTVTKRR